MLLRCLSFKTWHQKKESRRREWDIERGRVIITPLWGFYWLHFNTIVCHRSFVHSPLFLSSLNLILIPEDFRWQTMTDNIRKPQLTRETERINASDQSGYSHNLLSALEPDERAQNIVTGSSLFDLKVEVKQINSPYFQNVIEWLPNYVIALFLPNTTSSSISVWDSVGMHSKVWFIFLAHFYSWPSAKEVWMSADLALCCESAERFHSAIS